MRPRQRLAEEGEEEEAEEEEYLEGNNMLPIPGSPAASWVMYKARLASLFEGADPRVVIAFWLFGLINNVLYVIILTAALDLVGPNVPKGVVLLCNVIPSFIVKLLCPYFIHLIPYRTRILSLAAISILGMLLVVVSPAYNDARPEENAIATKMIGVALASASSGGGELTFLSLTHFYGPFSLAGWGSGTGGAGLIGAGAYALATTEMRLSSRGTLFASAFLPFVMVGSFFLSLPLDKLKRRSVNGPSKVDREEADVLGEEGEGAALFGHPERNSTENAPEEEDGLLQQSYTSLTASTHSRDPPPWTTTFAHNIQQMRTLFFPYMLPLLLVYIAEYTINQGVAPTLLFPLASSPFTHYRAFYPAYSTIYQAGVFVSRSSTPFVRLHRLYLPSFLQLLNLALLIAQALQPRLLGSVWVVFAIIFWEGLLGGAVYVNTFAEIAEQVPVEQREFSLGATSVSDSAGICVAGFVGMALEVGLCAWQVEHLGRDWCRQL